LTHPHAQNCGHRNGVPSRVKGLIAGLPKKAGAVTRKTLPKKLGRVYPIATTRNAAAEAAAMTGANRTCVAEANQLLI
jgi:hypothetical protein